MGSPTQSLASAVDGMLAQTVAGALGPTPAPKRKQPELEAAGQAPDEASATAEAAAEPSEAQAPVTKPPSKKAKTPADEPSAEPPSAAAAPPPTAAAPAAPAAAIAIPAPAPFLPPSAVDLEAALDELLASPSPSFSPDGAQPSTQPAVEAAAAAAAPAPASAKAAPTPVPAPEPDAAPAPTTDFDAFCGVEQLELQPTQPTSSAGSHASPAAAAAAPPAAADTPHAAPTSSLALAPAGVVLDSRLGGSPMLGGSPLPTTAAAAGAVAAAAASPPAASPPARSQAAPVHSPAAPPAAPLAAPAHSPAAPPASAAAAAACVPPPPPGPEPTAAAPPAAPKESAGHVNLLKEGVDEEYDGSSPAPSDCCGSASGSAGSCSPPPESAVVLACSEEPSGQCPPPPSRIADYQVEVRHVGSGGLGTVYAATHAPTGARVALKLGTCMVADEGSNDFTWTCFRTEWNTYTQLAGRGLRWLPDTYECGLVPVAGGCAPWMTMSLLGPSMHALNQRHLSAARAERGSAAPPSGLPHLGAYARGMLAALEGLHGQGYVHHDVKPANFCVEEGHVMAAAGAVPPPAPRVFLIDFGFSHRFDPARCGGPMEFVGTPDFASSATLTSVAPGPRDDLEALGYSLVELALGDLPWDVTHKGTGPDGRRPEASAWTQAALNRMLERRDAAWAAACGRGAIPAWLAAWVTYCKRLPAAAAPDYAYLRRLIGEGERQAATAAAAAAKAAGAHGWGAAWGAAEE